MCIGIPFGNKLPFISMALTDYFSGAGIESGKNIECTIAFIFIFNSIGMFPNRGGLVEYLSEPWLQRLLNCEVRY
jgi:hypothetical protein